METEYSDSEAYRHKMTWEEVYKRIVDRIPKGKIYGIPRGGAIVAGVIEALDPTRWQTMPNPTSADFLVDDIIDSGKTRTKWKNRYQKEVYALVDKLDQPEDASIGWIVFPWEVGSEDSGPEDAVTRLIEFVGEDPNREGLQDTPRRVIKAYEELTQGYRQNPKTILDRTFESSINEMVVLQGIRFTSLCEHHILPFTGEVAVGYLPDKRVVGISKLGRLVECFARRLQIQERMTEQIAQAIMTHLSPLGVGVVVKAHHSCMGCRGIKQPDTRMSTSCMLGVLRDNPAARAELLSLIG